MTKVLVTDNRTKAITIKNLSFDVPQYDIGYTVAYKQELANGIVKDIEAVIVGIRMEVALTSKDEIVTAVMYELDNGEDIFEEQVDYYYETDITIEEQQGTTNE